MTVTVIRHSFLAGLLTFAAIPSLHAAPSTACPEFTQPENWYAPLVIIDHAAKGGPPEIAQAATALRAGQRETAITLLTQVGKIPIEEVLKHSRAYMEAVLDAQENAWQLSGCP